MMGYDYSYTIRLGDNHISVPQQYETIHIKWDNGFMDIVPPGVFEIESSSVCTSKFRKLIKYSIENDIRYQTNLVSQWRKAIRSDLDFLYQVSIKIGDRYKELYDDIVDSSKNADKSRPTKLRNLQKQNAIELKRLDARKNRVLKCSKMLEDYVVKYM
jgi:hypothetical protein